MSGGSVEDFEVTLRNKDGAEVDMLLTATRITDHEGRNLGVNWVLYPISDRGQGQYDRPPSARVSVRTVPAERPLQESEAGETLKRGTSDSMVGSPTPAHGDSVLDATSRGDEILMGPVELIIPGSAGPITFLRFHGWLKDSSRSRLGGFKATAQGDKILTLTIPNPWPLARLLESPFVEQVVAETASITGMTSSIPLDASSPRRYRVALMN